jgi:RNA polymerase sigma-70 factor (ECF subfamily)
MTAQSLATTGNTDPLTGLIGQGAYREAVAMAARNHGAAIGRLCMAMLGSQAEAEEAAQEALIAAYDGMASYRGEGSVRAWLFGIARRICARRLETRTRQQNRLRLVYDAEAEAQLPDDVVEKRRLAQRVRLALEQLRPSEREAILLRYASELSYREVGEACGIDESAARKRASRALSRLREVLSEE